MSTQDATTNIYSQQVSINTKKASVFKVAKKTWTFTKIEIKKWNKYLQIDKVEQNTREADIIINWKKQKR